MRVGRNPNKGATGEGKAYTGKKVTVAMLTYIPDFTGYYRERFELLKLALSSMIAHTNPELADILVFDNGSCKEVLAYLQKRFEEGEIDYLIQSQHNLGYNGALNAIYSICQSSYLSYSDDDVFFHPRWLEEALKVMEAFPGVGMVCCAPSKIKYVENHQASKQLQEKFPDRIQKVEDVSAWKSDWDSIFLKSVGSDLSVRPELNDIKIPVLESNGVRCFPVSTHFHYLISRESIKHLYPFPVGDLMSSNFQNPDFNMRVIFDKKLDDAGIAKVTTDGLYTEHLGNVWSERADVLSKTYDFRIERKGKTLIQHDQFSGMQRLLFKVLNLPFIGKLIRWLYEGLFDLINAKSRYDRLNK